MAKDKAIPEHHTRRRIIRDLRVASSDEENVDYYRDDSTAALDISSILPGTGWHYSSLSRWQNLTQREENGEETGVKNDRVK